MYMYLFNLVLEVEAVMSLNLKDTEAGIKLNGALVNNLRFADDILHRPTYDHMVGKS